MKLFFDETDIFVEVSTGEFLALNLEGGMLHSMSVNNPLISDWRWVDCEGLQTETGKHRCFLFLHASHVNHIMKSPTTNKVEISLKENLAKISTDIIKAVS